MSRLIEGSIESIEQQNAGRLTIRVETRRNFVGSRPANSSRAFWNTHDVAKDSLLRCADKPKLLSELP
jgi:hypothetical protein